MSINIHSFIKSLHDKILSHFSEDDRERISAAVKDSALEVLAQHVDNPPPSIAAPVRAVKSAVARVAAGSAAAKARGAKAAATRAKNRAAKESAKANGEVRPQSIDNTGNLEGNLASVGGGQ